MSTNWNTVQAADPIPPGWSDQYKSDCAERVYSQAQQLNKLIRFVEGAVRPHKVIIAGGAIRDLYVAGPDMVKDYDLWVMDVAESNVVDLDKNLDGHFRGFEAKSRWSGDFMIGGENYRNPHFHSPSCEVIIPWFDEKKPVQIMYASAKSAEEMLQRFDWKACCFAWDGQRIHTDGLVDFENRTLSINNDIVIRTPRSTLRRGFHLEHKYRMSKSGHRLRLSNAMILLLASMLDLNENGKRKEDFTPIF